MPRNMWKQFKYTKDPDRIIARIKGKEYCSYRKKWKEAGELKKVQDYPIHLDFELHYGCNLRCPQCILQMDPNEFEKIHPYHIKQKKQKINFEKFKEIIDEGTRYGLCSITLGVNNEPLMDTQIIKYINYAFGMGILDIILITNGILLTKKMSKQLLESGLTKLYFSIDAIKEDTYKKVRTGGDLIKVMQNINYFLDLKKQSKKLLPVTRVSYVKSRINQSETEEFVEYWKPRVDFVSIQAFVTPAYGHSNYQKIRKEFQIENKNLKQSGPCTQPYQRLTIYHDGSVHPCCHWPGGTLIVGNIYTDSIYNIWNSAYMEKLRSDINTPERLPKECIICRKVVFGEK